MSDVKSGFVAPAAPEPGEFAATRVAVLSTRWNVEVIDALRGGAHRALSDWGVGSGHVTEFRAPGAYELPLAAHALLHGGRFDAVIALGAVIRGDTPHFEYVAGECARGLMDVQLKFNKPVAFGVLTVNTPQQATERCGPGQDNKGYEAVSAALDMIRLIRSAS
ncbi:6,7-dimethyl-8-ribityllumazine synthase [Panacagrimonas sp.]|uniref:6,7-dimethyl-8-ribityllumazine synthase n=1 Tax=Panacagrimonas sp. TaxID=2480088 RepID=UPI003B52091C